MNLIFGIVVMTLAAASAAFAQSEGLNHYSAPELHQMAQKLKEQESLHGTKIAAETLEKYPGHYTMLTVRAASGGAEKHQHYADVFFVVDGDATLITGGTLLNPKNPAPGETIGTAIEGGSRQELNKGDVVHIAPNTPHQLLISNGHSFSYFVIKVKE